jgi:hypothetical protein
MRPERMAVPWRSHEEERVFLTDLRGADEKTAFS